MQKAKFFCENCGAEVPEKARFCKHCGKFFTSVRCPKCGSTGPSASFAKGCPVCGYAAGGKSIPSPISLDSERRHLTRGEKKKLRSAFSSAAGRMGAREKEGDGTLPAWIYAITAMAMLAALFGVYSCMK